MIQTSANEGEEAAKKEGKYLFVEGISDHGRVVPKTPTDR
jgi:hypothetical protein